MFSYSVFIFVAFFQKGYIIYIKRKNMSDDSWIERSRYQTLREYKVISPHQVEVICHDVWYCSVGGSPTYITSIDPDGGPYLSIGKMIRSYYIKKIVSYQPWKEQKDKIRIVLEVEKVRPHTPLP